MSASRARAAASDELQQLLRDDEELLWRGTPNRWRLVTDGFKVLGPVLFVLWMIGVFVVFMVGLAIEAAGGDPLSILPMVGGVALLVVLVVAAGVFWVADRRYDHAEYAATDDRLVSFGGAFGRDASSVDWESVRDLEVTVGGLDGLFGTGTIHVATEGSGDLAFRYVDRPHELAAALDAVRNGDAARVDLGGGSSVGAWAVETTSSTWGAASTTGVRADAVAEPGAGPGVEDVSETLRGLLRPGEELQWHYRPPKRTYLLQTVVGGLLAGLLVWSIFYGLFVGVPVLAEFGPFVESLLGVPPAVAVAAGWVVLQCVWLAALGLGAWQAKDHLEFAATDQRCIKVGGFVGVDTSAVEWASATDVEVGRNLMTRLFGTGNVVVRSGGGPTSDGGGVRFGPVVDPMAARRRIEAIMRGDDDERPIFVAGAGAGGADAPVEATAATASPGSLSAQARATLRDSETLVWHGKPAVVPFVLPRLVGGLGLVAVGVGGFRYLGAFGLFVALAGLGTAGRRALSYRNVEYVATDQRVLSFGGAVGRDSSTVDWDDVRDVEVDVGPVDVPFDTGTLRFRRAGGTTPTERADAGDDEDAFTGVQFERVPGARRVAERLELGRQAGAERALTSASGARKNR